MDLGATLFSTSWASGVNAYATIVLLNLLGRVGLGDVPEPLQGDVVLIVGLVMYSIEFVCDKVPFLDSVWDAVHTVIRPVISGAIAAAYGSADELPTSDEVLATGGAVAIALASHAVKSVLRLGINTSPEPASNIIASLLEDGMVGVVVFLAVENPVAAAAIAAILLAIGICLAIILWKTIRRAYQALRRHYGREPPDEPDSPTGRTAGL